MINLFKLFIIFFLFFTGSFVFGEDEIYIIPQGGNAGGAVEAVSESPGKVWDTYNSQAKSLDTGDQFATGIMNWDTILTYIKYLVDFLSKAGLMIAALMIIYAGYLYAMSVYKGDGASKGKSTLMSAIAGVLIVVFAFFFISFLIGAFLEV